MQHESGRGSLAPADARHNLRALVNQRLAAREGGGESDAQTAGTVPPQQHLTAPWAGQSVQPLPQAAPDMAAPAAPAEPVTAVQADPKTKPVTVGHVSKVRSQPYPPADRVPAGNPHVMRLARVNVFARRSLEAQTIAAAQTVSSPPRPHLSRSPEPKRSRAVSEQDTKPRVCASGDVSRTDEVAQLHGGLLDELRRLAGELDGVVDRRTGRIVDGL